MSMNMECPNCKIELPYKARYFQYYTCKPCNMILVTGKERRVTFDLKFGLAMFVAFSFVTVPLNVALFVAVIASVLAIVWLHLKPPVFQIKEPAFVAKPKEQVDVAANIKRYKEEEQARKKASRKWFR